MVYLLITAVITIWLIFFVFLFSKNGVHIFSIKIKENGIIYTVNYYHNRRVWTFKKNYYYPHRENGPAIEYLFGTKAWYVHGKCHREDGAAIQYSNGNKEYWLNNNLYPDITSDDEWIIYNIIT